MKPWLSVLMPTFRGERYIAEALQSVAEQASSDVECLVVDDGSDDRTLEIARGFGDRLTLRFVEGPKRGSWVASTNAALAEARGDYACMLHQDDAWEPGRLSALRALRSAHPGARLFLHSARLVDALGEPLGTWTCPLPASPAVVSPSEMIERLLVQNFVAIPAPLFRVDDALGLGGLDECLWYTADWSFWLSLAALGDTVYVDRPLARFRIHGSSQTITRSRDAAAFREQLTIVVERHLARGPVRERNRVHIERAARLSIETNVALATAAHRGVPDCRPLLNALPLTDGRAWIRFVRDSRIGQRVGARVIATARGRLLG